MIQRLSAAAAIVFLSVPLVAGADSGEIQGQLVDLQNQAKAAKGVTIFVCNAGSGLPIVAKSKKALGKEAPIQGLGDIWNVMTNADGSFTISDVPAGSYRLVAQRWLGIEGTPAQKKESDVVYLHGAVGPITVRDGETARASIRPLGSATLKVEFDPLEAGAFLIVSTAPMLGDPILSYLGWGEEFVRNGVGTTVMLKPRGTIVGLPDDRDVHLASFHYDNVPGFGGGAFRAGENAVARIRIYSGWSNGHDDPPKKLWPLVEFLMQNNPPLPELMNLGASADFQDERGNLDHRKLWTAIEANATKTVDIEKLGEFRVIDVAAADAYRQLRRYHAERGKRQN